MKLRNYPRLVLLESKQSHSPLEHIKGLVIWGDALSSSGKVQINSIIKMSPFTHMCKKAIKLVSTTLFLLTKKHSFLNLNLVQAGVCFSVLV